MSLDVGLTGLAPYPVFAAELVRNFGAVCLNLLLVLRKMINMMGRGTGIGYEIRKRKEKKAHPHPFGTFYTPAQAVDVKTDASFARIVDANLVAFLCGVNAEAKTVVSEKSILIIINHGCTFLRRRQVLQA